MDSVWRGGWLRGQCVHRNNRRMGLVMNVAVGLLGALIGGWVSALIGIGTYAEFSLGSFLITLLGRGFCWQRSI